MKGTLALESQESRRLFKIEVIDERRRRSWKTRAVFKSCRHSEEIIRRIAAEGYSVQLNIIGSIPEFP